MNEQEAIKLLEEKGYKIEKPKTIIIDKTEYELEQHDNGIKFDDLKIPTGWRLLKPWEAQRLWDLGYLRDNWFFVENTNKELKEEGDIARFCAISGGAYLNCDGGLSVSDAGLGVLFARDLK